MQRGNILEGDTSSCHDVTTGSRGGRKDSLIVLLCWEHLQVPPLHESEQEACRRLMPFSFHSFLHFNLIMDHFSFKVRAGGCHT